MKKFLTLAKTIRKCSKKKIVTLAKRIRGHSNDESAHPPPQRSAAPDKTHELERSLSSSVKGSGWNVMKRVLVVVQESSDVFPPLKSVVGGVVAIMEEVEVVGNVEDGFREVTRKIECFCGIVARHTSEEDLLPALRSRLTDLSLKFQELYDTIDNRTGHGLVKRTLHARADIQVIEGVFREITMLFEVFQTDTLISIEIKCEKIHKEMHQLLQTDQLPNTRYESSAQWSEPAVTCVTFF